MGAAKQPLPPILPETTTRPSLPRTPPMAKSGAVGAGGSMDNGAPAFSPLSVAGRTSEAVKNTDIKIESNNNRFANPGLSGPAGPRGPQGPRGPVGLPGPTSARKAEKFGPPGMAPINVQLRRPSSTVDGNTEAGIPGTPYLCRRPGRPFRLPYRRRYRIRRPVRRPLTQRRYIRRQRTYSWHQSWYWG